MLSGFIRHFLGFLHFLFLNLFVPALKDAVARSDEIFSVVSVEHYIWIGIME